MRNQRKYAGKEGGISKIKCGEGYLICRSPRLAGELGAEAPSCVPRV